jgi:hypothetical protein
MAPTCWPTASISVNISVSSAFTHHNHPFCTAPYRFCTTLTRDFPIMKGSLAVALVALALALPYGELGYHRMGRARYTRMPLHRVRP